MKSIARKGIIGAALLIAGAVLGPVVFAAIGAALFAYQNHDTIEAANETALLIEAYQQQLPIGRLFLTILPPEDGGECGYDPEELFPDASDEFEHSMQERRFSYYAGYYALDRWRNKSRDDEYITAIAANIEAQTSVFEVGFLRRCITSTLFRPICMEKVSGFSSGVDRFDHSREPFPALGWGIEDEIVCTYADGVAARRGIPLMTPE